ncbi:metal-dependent hydrolase [Desulfovibrio aminophilus]|uniref:metal-dependent hydrolase n=1 Tax=Desulfovibrio aminophilus TaxID=81425 RepID=UPI003390B2C9
MPGYKGHIAGALCAAGLLGLGLWFLGLLPRDWLTLAGLTGFCLVGALFPDIDTKSKGQYLFYAALLAVDAGLLLQKSYEWAAYLGLAAIIPGVTPHRGWTHSVWSMLLIPQAVWAVPVFLYDRPAADFLPYALALGLGYFSHLLLDGELLGRGGRRMK